MAGQAPKTGVAAVPKGQPLYTKFSLYYEKNVHRTTNYQTGALLPVNSDVTFVSAGKDQIVVALPGGQELKIENVQNFSGEDIDGIYARTFSPQKTDLSQFTALERKAILDGEAKPGMKKAAVLVALGHPPTHKTPSLESNQWRYWKNRFDTFVVHFDNGAVSQIEN